MQWTVLLLFSVLHSVLSISGYYDYQVSAPHRHLAHDTSHTAHTTPHTLRTRHCAHRAHDTPHTSHTTPHTRCTLDLALHTLHFTLRTRHPTPHTSHTTPRKQLKNRPQNKYHVARNNLQRAACPSSPHNTSLYTALQDISLCFTSYSQVAQVGSELSLYCQAPSTSPPLAWTRILEGQLRAQKLFPPDFEVSTSYK